MAIFHSYVSLPEGISPLILTHQPGCFSWLNAPFIGLLLRSFDLPPRDVPVDVIISLLVLQTKHMSYGQYSWLITINRG